MVRTVLSFGTVQKFPTAILLFSHHRGEMRKKVKNTKISVVKLDKFQLVTNRLESKRFGLSRTSPL